jgi:hypothetical protein
MYLRDRCGNWGVAKLRAHRSMSKIDVTNLGVITTVSGIAVATLGNGMGLTKFLMGIIE